MPQTRSGLQGASTARSTTRGFTLLLQDIPFQICFVFLVTVIGPLYLTVWTIDILLVALLNKIYCGLQAIGLETPGGMEGMDRFTRTREHYQRGLHRSRQQETPPTPPAADLVFDFDFKDSKLDLNFDIGHPVVQNDLMVRHQIDPSENIGVALSDGPFQQRGRLGGPVTMEDEHSCLQQQNECLSSVPKVPSEPCLRFSTQCEKPSRNLPPCSIYSREWRERVRRTTTPPEPTADLVTTVNVIPFSERTSTDDMNGSHRPNPANRNQTDRETSPPLPSQTCPKNPDDGSEAQALQPDFMLEESTSQSRKRLSKIGKWLLRPRKHWDKKAAMSSTNMSVEKMLSNTPTPCPSSVQDTSKQHQHRRLGDALRTRVAQKQSEAQDQISQPRPLTASLRGGGNFNSVNTGRRWDNDQDTYNRRRRGAYRHSSSGIFAVHNSVVIFAESEDRLDDIHRPHSPSRRPIHQPRRPRSPRDPPPWLFPRSPQNRNHDGADSLRPAGQTPPGNSQTRIQVHRRPGRRTLSHEDGRRGRRPEERTRIPGGRRPEHRTQGEGEHGCSGISRSTPPNQTDNTTPPRLSAESQSSQTSPPKQPSSTGESAFHRPSSHRSTASGPPAKCNKRPEAGDELFQASSPAGPSRSQQHTDFARGTSIRISLNDGRVLSTTEYKALQEKRAGKAAVRLKSTDENRTISSPGVKGTGEEQPRGQGPASKEGSRRDKPISAEPSPKEVQIPPASPLEVPSGQSSPRREASGSQHGGTGGKTQSRKPELAQSSAKRSSLVADTKGHSTGPLLATDHGNEAIASAKAELNERPTTIIARASSLTPGSVFSTSQQHRSTAAGVSSQQSPPTSSLPRETSGLTGPASQPPTTRIGKISSVVDSPPARTSGKQGTALSNRPAARSNHLPSSDDGNSPQEMKARNHDAGDAPAETGTEGEPTWSFANLKP
ncbi:uncharacterized protein PV07_00969 [Cladophialophora immunda]|uniref:Uncharacterized protein n=1 Tax=Cladophialophora immunda TaxID=569365 RepID=A0A0D2DEP9_9EURO|nr:uncharacterized protein PV07_00969 [Cladophialophora immunda]KIW34174.1 hypothetical protein PV07_00969 [Cladophialophora immunda]